MARLGIVSENNILHKFNMSEHESIAGQLAELMKMMTTMASEQARISNDQSKMASEQIKISKMASEQTKMANDQSKLAMAQNQLTERLETVAYRQNTLSACREFTD